jgi:cytochrome c-type biogenesis protein
MITVYFSLITGLSLEELESIIIQKKMKRHIIINALIFIAAFTLVFTVAGGLVSRVGHILQDKIRYLNVIGGIFVVFLGLKMTGLVKLKFLHSFDLSNKFNVDDISTNYRYISTFLIGILFAIVCSHCIGATLYSILMLTGATKVNGFLVMFLFSLGLAIPYFLVGLSFNRAMPIIKKLGKYRKGIQLIMGIILIIFGLLMISNKFILLTKLLNKIIPFRLPYSM